MILKKWDLFLNFYIKAVLALIIAFCLLRGYEYVLIASKSFNRKSYLYEMSGCIYDIWICLIYSVLIGIPLFIISLFNFRINKFLAHLLNVLFIITYIGLILVFSERNAPFDHEILTRSIQESWITTKQMMTSSFTLFVPFIFFITLYFYLLIQFN